MVWVVIPQKSSPLGKEVVTEKTNANTNTVQEGQGLG